MDSASYALGGLCTCNANARYPCLLSPAVSATGLDNCTALASPIALPWLPTETLLAGFEDWYDADKDHYSAVADPLKLSNLDEELLPALRDIKLRDVSIRHVVLVKLESTRKDVFPIKRDGIIWERLVSTFKNKSLPENAQKRLASLTPTAKFLTGDHDDGFPDSVFADSAFEDKQKPRSWGNQRQQRLHYKHLYPKEFGWHSLWDISARCRVSMSTNRTTSTNPVWRIYLRRSTTWITTGPRSPRKRALLHSNGSHPSCSPVTDRYDKQDRLMPVLGYAKEHERMIDWVVSQRYPQIWSC